MTNLKPLESLRRGIAVVHFRITGPKRRGYYRVLVVKKVRAASYDVRSSNVVDVLYNGPEGSDALTEKSAYYLGPSRAVAKRIADDYNMVRDWS